MKFSKYVFKNLLRLSSKKKYHLRRTRRFILGILAGLILISSLVGCIQKPLEPLLVGYSVWPGYESLYLARELGYYKDTSIRLVDYPSNSEIIRAFRNGNLQAVTLTLYEALLLAETQADVRIMLIMDSSNGGDVILGKPEVKTLQDIKGKRIGVESGALGAFVLTRGLEQVALKPKDVQIVSFGVSEHEHAYNQGKVDAIVTYEPTRSKLLAAGANLLFDSSQISGEILDVLVVRKELLSKRSSEIQALINGHFRALNYLEKNPDDGARRIAPREGITPEQFLKSLVGLHIPNLQENQKLLGKNDTASVNRVKKVATFMVDNKLLKKYIDPISLFDNRIVQEVKLSTEDN